MQDEIIIITFPYTDKIGSLKEVKEDMEKYPSKKEKCVVLNKVELESSEYFLVSNNLLTPENDKLWNGVGGRKSNAPELQGKTRREIRDSEELSKIWEETKVTMVTEVVEKGTENKFYVDTAGWNMARYVGLLLE